MKKNFCLTYILFFSVGLFGQTALFNLLKPQQTNVKFNNKVQDTKSHNILIYSNYYGGAGVGIGDFNKDGKPDLYFAGNLVGDRIYFNQGQFVFEDVTEKSGILNRGGWSSGVAVVDINNDGWDDIYVSKELYDDRPDLRKNELYINQGAGKFVEMAAEYGLDSDARTRQTLFFDYDKDGWLDAYLMNHPPNAGNFSDQFGVDENKEEFASRLYKNTGKGKFIDVSDAAGIKRNGFPNSGIASDLNNDGWTDLYVANDFAKPDWMFINNGDGTFEELIGEATRHISFYSMGVDAGDINNDGWMDLMVLDMQAEDNFRIKSNMSGMNPEAFWEVYENGGHYQYMFNALHLNQSSSNHLVFSDIAQLAGVSNSDWSWSNLIADFDNDGWKDIIVTNGLLRDIRNTDSDKAVAKHIQHVIQDFVTKNPNAGQVRIWDILDLEETLELIPSVPLQNFAYKNNGDLSFSKVSKDWGLDKKTFSNGSAYADLDGDGDLDLVISNINEVAFIYENQSDRLQKDHHFLRVQVTDMQKNSNPFGVKIQLKVEGQPDQWYEFSNIRGMYSTSEQVAHFGISKANKVSKINIFWLDGTLTVLEDVELDQLLVVDYSQSKKVENNRAVFQPIFNDITEQCGVDFEHKENVFDDFEKQVLLPHKMSQFGPALAVGDVNNDQLDDFYIGGASGQSGRLFVQKTDGTFKGIRMSAFESDAVYEDVDAVFFDVDNDMDLDLYVVSGGNAHPPLSENYKDRLYENNGTGVFTRKENALPPNVESGSCVRPFDVDADGDLDLFVGGRHLPWEYPKPVSSRILENQKGTFLDVTAESAPALLDIGMVTDALWMDIDQDGLEDLIVVGEWMPITVFKQTTGHHFQRVTPETLGLDHSEGWWFSISAADLDQDGDKDLVAGNLGLNYKYKATPQQPFEVFFSDFDDNGTKDIVLSYYNYGKKYPLRGRSCSSQQIPMLKDKFPTYDLFAEADLETVYDPKELENAFHQKASIFSSVFIENKGDGRFSIHPLPNEAQFSSINATILEDFNQDGTMDLLIAGNLFVSEVETPRNDASIGGLLKNNGNGNFEPAKPFETGLSLPFDVKKMAKIKIGSSGEEQILVAPNNGKLRMLSFLK